MGKFEEIELKKIIGFQNGFAFKSKLFKNNGLPIVRISNLQDGIISEKNIAFFNPEDYSKDFTSYEINKGDLLIAMSGATTGKISINQNEKIYYLNQRVGKFIIDNETLKNYITFFLETKIEEHLGKAVGAAIPNLSSNDIMSLKIPLPPLPEQQRIVAKLDGLFAKIDKAIGLLEENIEHIQALMGSVLDEELSRFETKTLKIKDVLSEINSGFACNKSNEIPDGYVHLRTHNIDTSGNLNFDLMVKINPKKVDKKKNQIKKGDILFNNTNSKELVGKTALVDQDYDYGYSNHLTRIRLKEDLVIPEFFVNYMINLHSSGYFLQICKKWIGQAGVNTGMLKDTEIKFPSIENQIILNKKIEAIKESCTDLINQKTQKLNHLKALKSSLLDQAFKGEL
ncbi:restriction endonuclease subunit S [Aquaticitalea lipolytica]|uniref:restriction endonuclease subunit S n=1 Tax=Aquaticitalea lipolytica TaxID=1247562 RepID=UPI0024BA2352|nr:restriction endonuclease subunit S [Aquaticitalea lipolytica]